MNETTHTKVVSVSSEQIYSIMLWIVPTVALGRTLSVHEVAIEKILFAFLFYKFNIFLTRVSSHTHTVIYN